MGSRWIQAVRGRRGGEDPQSPAGVILRFNSRTGLGKQNGTTVGRYRSCQQDSKRAEPEFCENHEQLGRDRLSSTGEWLKGRNLKYRLNGWRSGLGYDRCGGFRDVDRGVDWFVGAGSLVGLRGSPCCLCLDASPQEASGQCRAERGTNLGIIVRMSKSRDTWHALVEKTAGPSIQSTR